MAVYGCIVAPLIAASFALAQPPRAVTPAPPSLIEGEQVFEQTCGNQYCHGPGGRGAMGPRLAGVPIGADTVRATIEQGRAGTPMQPFRNVLTPTQLTAVIAYAQSIVAPGRPAPVAGGPGGAGGRGTPQQPDPSPVPVAIGKEQGTPAAGNALFFDSTRISTCRTCHSFYGRGGPLGLDFADARKTPAEILAAITTPRVVARAYPVITIVTTKGAKVTGIRGRETEDTLQVYDIMVPPVRRTFAKADIVDIQLGKVGVYDHTKLVYTRQERLDLAALLGTAKPE